MMTIAIFCMLSITAFADDFSSWTTVASGTTNQLRGVSYGNGVFVTVGAGGIILTSTDRTTWTPRTSGTTNTLNGVTYGNETFVVAGDQGVILTSTDGIIWTKRTSGITSILQNVFYINNQFIAVGYSGVILTSTDAIVWTKKIIPEAQNLIGIAYSGSKYVAVDDYSIFTSTDLTNWTNLGYSALEEIRGIVYANCKFVIIDSYCWIGTSVDGSNWDYKSSGLTFWAINYINGQFISAGWNKQIFTSTDGNTWNLRYNGSSNPPLNGVTGNNNQIVAVGSNGVIMINNLTDITPPTIAPTESPTTPTTGSITIIGGVSDSGSGVAATKWASGSQPASYFSTGGTAFTTSFTIAANGTYTIYAKDNAGNEAVNTITITNHEDNSQTNNINVTNGKESNLALRINNIADFSPCTFSLTYDPQALTVTDLCALTANKELAVGVVKGTDIEIISFTPGNIVFKVNRQIAQGQKWSGVANVIKYRGNINGQLTVTFKIK